MFRLLATAFVSSLILTSASASETSIYLRSTPHTMGTTTPVDTNEPSPSIPPSELTVDSTSLEGIDASPARTTPIRLIVSNAGEQTSELPPAPIIVDGPFRITENTCQVPVPPGGACYIDVLLTARIDGQYAGTLKVVGIRQVLTLKGTVSGFAPTVAACTGAMPANSACLIDGVVVTKLSSGYLMRCDAGMLAVGSGTGIACASVETRMTVSYNDGSSSPDYGPNPRDNNNGKANTDVLTTSSRESQAARHCRSLGSKWYLPGATEISNQMHEAGFATWTNHGPIWSSTGNTRFPNLASSPEFVSSSRIVHGHNSSKTDLHGVRCSRQN